MSALSVCVDMMFSYCDFYELFLGGDHYKWRQIRSNGIDERYITGDADNYDKWLCFAKTMPKLIGNPLYHWTHLELKRYFDIDLPLNEKNAKEIWNEINNKLKLPEYSLKNLIRKSNVDEVIETLIILGKEYAKRGWVMQLHIGALRNNNTKMYEKLGVDTGFDSG